MKIVLTGGGSGGHIIPNLALLPKLKEIFSEIHYIGSINGIEKNIIKNYPEIKYHEIHCAKFNRSLTPKNFIMPILVFKGISESKKILASIKPDVIFSKGGYVAVPVCIAGARLKIPVIGHESDLTMGLANKIIYKMSVAFCCSFKSTAKNYEKCVFTGSPIRKEIFTGNRELTLKKLNFSELKPAILIMGGSLGSTNININVYPILNKLLETFNIIHIVGKGNLQNEFKYSNYYQIEYSNNIEDLLACSNLIVSRAGSNSIFEFLALKKPTLLIPLGLKASRGDQIKNAEYFSKNQLAKVLKEEDLLPTTLYNKIMELYKKKDFYINNMKNFPNSNGVENIINVITKFKKK